MKKTQLGLAVIAALPMFSSVQAIAADSSGEEIEKIEVTGSRIKRADMETASPVTLIGADDIKAMGATSIDSVLQKMTASGGAMTNPGINNGSGGNARVDLRGLGAQRTLVLVNGRRMVNSGTNAASTVDLNTIPVSMIKSVEVLKDGASAVYGTDAVAGVVNIILKDDFEGLDMNANTAITHEGDAPETSIDFTVGTNFDKGNIVFGMQYTDRGSASQADRDFSDCPIAESAGGQSLNCNGGSVYSEGGHIWQDGTIGDVDKQGNTVDEFGNKIETGLAHNDAGLSGLGGVHPYSDVDRYNFAPDSYLYTPMERLNITGLASYELSNDTTLFSEFTYTKRWSEQQMAPQPIWFGFTYDEAMGDSLLNQTYNSKVDRNGDGIADRDAEGNYITETANYAYGDKVFYGRRMSDTGPRQFSQTVDTVRAVVGAEGFVGEYSWDLSATFGRNDSVDKLANLHNVGAISDEDSIAQYNNDGQVVGFNPLDQEAWVSEDFRKNVYTEVNNGGNQLFIVAGTISGEMFELPAGYSAFAAGFEHRQEKAWYTPDSLTAQGLANDPPVEETSGGYDVTEAYVEFSLPLLADMSFAQLVDLSAAVRAFNYSTFGSDETWKLGLTWRVNDELMLRSVRSTAYRAPTVDELYGGKSPSFERVDYPGAQDQAEVTVGGNPDLTPEEADTLTAGFVYEPQWFEGFSMTFDYYDIEIDNAITEVDAQYVVETCLANASANANSDLCQKAGITLDSTGRIAFNNQQQNIGSEQTSGIDLNLAYSFEAADLSWRAGLDTTYLDEYKVTATGDTVNYAGLITSGLGGYARVKSNFTLNVSGDNWDAQYQARYIDGMDSASCVGKEASCYAPSTPSVTYHDISGNYIVSETVTLTGGINNLFDKQPPYYTGNNDSNTDPFTYDVLGRRFFAGVNVKF